MVPHWRSVRDANSLGLEELQCDLLRQHYIPDGNMTSRHEAQQSDASPPLIEFFHVQLIPALDAVALAGVAAGHLEVPAGLVLLALWQ